ncbi:MAG: T9SS type A sorting domain-containing protein [Cytophagales bacterium]
MRLLAIFWLLFLITILTSRSQNLIINGDASAPIGSEWTQVTSGWSRWNQTNGGIPDRTTFSTTKTGYHFGISGGCPTQASSPLSEMYQDVDVNTYASQIDAGTAQFTFNGYYATYANQEYSSVIIEFRDASKNLISTPYSSGNKNDSPYCTNTYYVTNCWKAFTTYSGNPPSGTRYIRIRLISKCKSTSGTDNDGYYDDLSLTYTGATTPVSLLYFVSNKLEGNNQLLWSVKANDVTNQINISMSLDGINFENIYTEYISYNTSVIENSFIDAKTSNEDTYYKIQVISYNGLVINEKIIFIKSKDSATINTYPNPFEEKIVILHTLDVQIELLNVDGKTIQSAIYLKNESGKTTLEAQDLMSGIYFLKINSEENSYTFKVYKN